ncbi:MAG: hypothetical protein KKA81_01275 [Bacteroidetes bacterium]|nr:hypothetical protein [Bacteroidota bacterium]
MELKPVWTDEYEIRWYDCNIDGKLSIPALCNFLQETAWHHADHLGFGMEETFEKDMGWVLLVLQIKIESYPGWLEHISLDTWPANREKYLAFREFRIKDKSGDTIGTVRATYLIIDLKTKRPKNTELLQKLEYLCHEELAGDFKTFAFEKGTQLIPAGEHKILYSDIDHYGHANNSKYLQWVIDALPNDFIRTHVPDVIEIKFLHECFLGEKIMIFSNPVDYSHFEGRRESDDVTNFQVKIRWKIIQ